MRLAFDLGYLSFSTRDGAMQKLVWRLKLEAEFGAGNTTEIEVARIEREAWADPERLGLSLLQISGA
jgi:hypothetical protein